MIVEKWSIVISNRNHYVSFSLFWRFRSFRVKFFHGDVVQTIHIVSWQGKFENFAQKFSELKAKLNNMIFVILHRCGMEIRERVKVLDKKLDQVLAILSKCTDVECEITHYIWTQGGISRCLEQESAVRELITISENRISNPSPPIGFWTTSSVAFGGDFHNRMWGSRHSLHDDDGSCSEAYGEYTYTSRWSCSSYDYGPQILSSAQLYAKPSPIPIPVSYSGSYHQPQSVPHFLSPGVEVNYRVNVAKCRRDITYIYNASVDTLLCHHTATWRFKMDSQTAAPKEIQLSMAHIEQELGAGPHEQILNPYFHKIWATEVSVIDRHLPYIIWY